MRCTRGQPRIFQNLSQNLAILKTPPHRGPTLSQLELLPSSWIRIQTKNEQSFRNQFFLTGRSAESSAFSPHTGRPGSTGSYPTFTRPIVKLSKEQPFRILPDPIDSSNLSQKFPILKTPSAVGGPSPDLPPLDQPKHEYGQRMTTLKETDLLRQRSDPQDIGRFHH